MQPAPFMLLPQAFTPEQMDAIEGLGDAMLQQEAALGAGNAKTRITKIAGLLRDARTEPLYIRIMSLVERLNTQAYRFQVMALETIQYTVHHGEEGGHYDWHVDHGPENSQSRKISLIIQLTDPAQYEGSNLEFQAGPMVITAPRERGMAIAFPSFTLNRVTSILSGTRKSLVVWATGPNFR